MPKEIRSLLTETLNGKKINVFLIFFVVSFIVWTLVKLSNVYTDTIKMTVHYTNLSEDKILLGSQESVIVARVRTTGFRMLRQKLFIKKLEVDLGSVNKMKADETHYVLSDDAINKHIYQDIEILKVSPDTLFLKLGKNKTREIPVVHQLELAFENGYNLYDSLQLQPETIEVSGPEDVVDSLEVVYTEIKKLEDINKNINVAVKILKNDSLKRLKYSQTSVKAVAKVDKFTEGKLKVPLRVQNLPQGYSIKGVINRRTEP